MSNNKSTKTYPNKDWDLDDWFKAVGVKSDSSFADEASRLGVTEVDKPWTNRQIGIEKKGTKDREPGIRKRDLALDYLAVLKAFADRNDVEFFAPERLEHTVTLFLNSGACRHRFAPLDDTEFYQLFQQKRLQKSNYKGINNLRSRVQPALPIKLFGRDNDLFAVNRALRKHPVVLINGVAGDGKTTLAWYSAVQAYQTKYFTDFDWTTDKRHVVDTYGQLAPIQDHQTAEAFLTKLLVSLCRQFSWIDLLGAQDNQLINACADRLRAGRYLIVVDNLESLENSETIVRQLLDMLSPVGVDEPVSSRALITSRKQVLNPNVALVSIGGIDESERIAYINSLQDLWQVKKCLSVTHSQEIARLTSGNPLFIQIAVRRYALMPSTIEQILADIAGGKHQAFNTLFEPLLKILEAETLCFAINLAYELSVSESSYEIEDLETVWQELHINKGKNQSQFRAILSKLISHRIINISGVEGYSMHPLIQAFLMTLDDDTVQLVCQ